MSSTSKSKILKTEPLDQKDAKWATLVKTTYTDPEGVERTWESGERLTRPAGTDIDGVGVVAILRDPTKPDESPRIVLVAFREPLLGGFARIYRTHPEKLPLTLYPPFRQKQWRPPIDKTVIEVPAGLMDPKESPETCAIRELKEESGYVGEVMGGGFGVSPVMFNDPGFCNTNLRMIHLNVDLSNPANQNPQPELEDNEFIETFAVPLKDLWAECKKFEQEGYAIDARVGTLAEGVELAKRWKFT